MTKRRKRIQKPKGLKGMGNSAMHDAMVEIRRSNATVPIPSGTTYRRRPKHGRFEE